MLKKYEQSETEFGFWHNLSFGEGISKTVASAKKTEDWLLFNLYRQDAANAGYLLFGPPSENGDWTVKSERGDIYRFGKDKDGYIAVEVFSNMEELSDAKLYMCGARFLNELANSVRQLESQYPKKVQEMSIFKDNLHCQPEDAPEDIFTFDQDDAIIFEPEDMSVEIEFKNASTKKRRQKF